MSTWGRKPGDYGPPIVAELDGSVDLAAVETLWGVVSLRGGVGVVLPGEVNDVEARRARLDLSAWLPDVDDNTTWDLDWKADVLNEDDPVTWPETGHDRINVGRDLT
jgi:hypothetical protein